MTNSEIASLLRNIAASYAISDEKKYRFQIIAYQKAADTIEESTTEVKDLVADNKLSSLPGVGPSIQNHLIELIKTGKVKHFDAILQNIPEAVFPLLAVPTFGPKKAYKLTKEFDLNDPKKVIDTIYSLAKKGKIAKLEGFGEKSQNDIIRAIEEFRRGEGKVRRMNLPFAGELAEQILHYLRASKDVISAMPLGSLRRMVSTIGDIDIAVATKNSKKVLEYFTNYPKKERIIEKGSATSSIIISGGKQIDLMTMPVDSFGSLLQHFTGSKAHNIHLREYALQKGISLSEYGMKVKLQKGTKMKKIKTEEAFYQTLGLAWIPPELREDTGEIEAAIRQTQGKQPGLPKLVELRDIKGDFHTHSSYPIEPSHDMGQNTMQHMLNKAKELGYEYLAFSEHNPSISNHSREQVYSILSRRKDYIEQLKSHNKSIRIINLLETDILPNGELAIDEKSLSTLDATLVSIHSSFGMSKDDMTKRIITGLSHPKAKILSHPTGRIINDRIGYDLDFEKIFAFCKKNNKALEINAWPTRLDLPDTLVKQAVQLGVIMTIDTDSHATEQMHLMEYGVAVARRGWAEKRDILNTLPYNSLKEWLQE